MTRNIKRDFTCVLATTLAMLALLSCLPNAWPAEPETSELTGIVEPRPAPAWDIDEWINSDPGTVSSNLNSVIVIDFFQLWCPACNAFTGPLMQQWQNRFSDEIASGDLLLVKIHTVFEGHSYQTVKRLKGYLQEKHITLPVGVDRHENDYLPETKKRYQTRGTPEIVMIDRQGMIRFQRFGWFDPVLAEKYLETLLGGAASPKRTEPVQVCLASELCG